MRVHICMQMGPLGWACVQAGGWCLFAISCLSCVLTQGLWGNMEHVYLDCGQTILSPSGSSGVTGVHIFYGQLSCGFWDLNSGSCVCLTRTLHTNLAPQMEHVSLSRLQYLYLENGNNSSKCKLGDMRPKCNDANTWYNSKCYFSMYVLTKMVS